MAWTTPKINWATDDVIGVDDLNEIGNNLQYLYDLSGAGSGFGANIASATSIVLTNKNHHITGTTPVAEIKPNWTPKSGDVIRLICNTSGNFTVSTSPPTSGYYRIKARVSISGLAGIVSVNFVFDDTLTIGGVVGAWVLTSTSYI